MCNPLKPKCREREREENVGEVATDTIFNGRKTSELIFKFMTTKVPRQCPLVLPVEIG
jgi:hypothetical protein